MLATVDATSVATATVIASHDLKVLHVEPPVSVAALDPEGIAHSVPPRACRGIGAIVLSIPC